MQHFKSAWCKWGALPRKVTLHYSLICPPLAKYAALLFFWFSFCKLQQPDTIKEVIFFMFFLCFCRHLCDNMWLYIYFNLTLISSLWLCYYTNTAGNGRGLLLALHTRSALLPLIWVICITFYLVARHLLANYLWPDRVTPDLHDSRAVSPAATVSSWWCSSKSAESCRNVPSVFLLWSFPPICLNS